MLYEAGPSVLPQVTESDQGEEASKRFYFIPNRWGIGHRRGVNTLVCGVKSEVEMVLSPG